MTAAYMTRCVYLTFFGEYRGSVAHELAEVHEAEVLAEGDELVEHHLAEEQDDYIPASVRTTADVHGTAAREQPVSSRCRCGCCRSSRCSPASSTARHFEQVREVVPAPRPRSSDGAAPATFNVILAAISVAIARRRHRRSRTPTTGAKPVRRASRERNALARARQALPRQQVLPRRPLRATSSSAASRARSPPASTGSTRTSSTTS